jgi:hypothetical protein
LLVQECSYAANGFGRVVVVKGLGEGLNAVPGASKRGVQCKRKSDANSAVVTNAVPGIGIG